MQEFMTILTDHFVAVLIGFCVALTILTRSMTTIYLHGATERSRREIAAYIAEGSLTPEQGERILRADVGRRAGV